MGNIGKALFGSKTIWFNALALAVLVANAFGFANFQVDPQMDKYAGMAILVVNIIFRLVTNKPITGIFSAK